MVIGCGDGDGGGGVGGAEDGEMDDAVKGEEKGAYSGPLGVF